MKFAKSCLGNIVGALVFLIAAPIVVFMDLTGIEARRDRSGDRLGRFR